MPPRVIIPQIPLFGNIELPKAQSRHIFGSLRLKAGSKIIISNANRQEALCELISENEARFIKSLQNTAELPLDVHIFPSLAKGERFEWLLQKSVELGAASITPVLSSRCVATAISPSKHERFSRIILSAAEQSGRGVVPKLDPPISFNEALKAGLGLRLFCFEGERAQTLKAALTALSTITDVSVMTGPEGGYSDEEVSLALNSGWNSVTLGKAILRCETAPLMVLSAVKFILDA